MVTTSSNKGFSVPTVGGDAGVWGNELNTTINDLDTILGGSITFNASAAATVTLTASQAQFNRIIFSGTPGSSMTLNFMSSQVTGGYGNFDVWNATSTSANGAAGFNILCQVTSTSTGSTVTVPVSNMRLVNVDNQNVQFADQIIIPVTTLPPVLNGYISGLVLSNTSSNANNGIAFSSGIATDSSAITYMQNAASFNKTSSAVWALGAGNGGMGTGLSFTAGTWYHTFIISNGTSSNIDFYFDTSVTAANKPANTNYFRRIASMVAMSSAAVWQTFVQDGDLFEWSSPVNDVNLNPPDTNSHLTTMTVPPNLNVRWVGNLHLDGAGTGVAVYWSDPATTDVAATVGVATAPGATIRYIATPNTDVTMFVSGGIRTNQSQQIRYRANGTAGVSIRAFTTGWYDTRGK